MFLRAMTPITQSIVNYMVLPVKSIVVTKLTANAPLSKRRCIDVLIVERIRITCTGFCPSVRGNTHFQAYSIYRSMNETLLQSNLPVLQSLVKKPLGEPNCQSQSRQYFHDHHGEKMGIGTKFWRRKLLESQGLCNYIIEAIYSFLSRNFGIVISAMVKKISTSSAAKLLRTKVIYRSLLFQGD